jgi:hypothetical protein
MPHCMLSRMVDSLFLTLSGYIGCLYIVHLTHLVNLCILRPIYFFVVLFSFRCELYCMPYGKNVKLSLCLSTTPWKRMGEWMNISTFSYLGTEVSSRIHVPAALPPGKSPLYPLDRRLSGPQSRSGQYGEVKILAPTGTRTPTHRSSSQYPVTIPTVLSWLLYWMPYIVTFISVFCFVIFGQSNYMDVSLIYLSVKRLSKLSAIFLCIFLLCVLQNCLCYNVRYWWRHYSVCRMYY